MDLLRDWYNIVARNNQLALLLVLLCVGTVFVAVTADILAPFYAAVTIAYVMEVAMRRMQRRGVARAVRARNHLRHFHCGDPRPVRAHSRSWAAIGTARRPDYRNSSRAFRTSYSSLPERYPALVTPDQLDNMMDDARSELLGLGAEISRNTCAVPSSAW